MPWSFDRLFKYDVTKVFRQMSLRPDSEYHFRVKLTAVNGTRLDSSLLEAPSVSFVPGRGERRVRLVEFNSACRHTFVTAGLPRGRLLYTDW